MIYEMRTYRCMPNRLPDVLRRFETVTVALFAKHGIKPAGFWTTLVGESNNDLVYLLAWDSLADREVRWAAFGRDPDWLRAREDSERDGPIVESISNQLLAPAAFSTVR